MNRSTASGFLAGLGVGIAVAWLLESALVGRGVVSTYLAPVAIVAFVAAAALRRRG
jgi:hypothetical protein